MYLAYALVVGSLVATPSVGEVAPDFTAVDTTGKSWTLSKMVEE